MRKRNNLKCVRVRVWARCARARGKSRCRFDEWTNHKSNLNFTSMYTWARMVASRRKENTTSVHSISTWFDFPRNSVSSPSPVRAARTTRREIFTNNERVIEWKRIFRSEVTKWFYYCFIDFFFFWLCYRNGAAVLHETCIRCAC